MKNLSEFPDVTSWLKEAIEQLSGHSHFERGLQTAYIVVLEEFKKRPVSVIVWRKMSEGGPEISPREFSTSCIIVMAESGQMLMSNRTRCGWNSRAGVIADEKVSLWSIAPELPVTVSAS